MGTFIIRKLGCVTIAWLEGGGGGGGGGRHYSQVLNTVNTYIVEEAKFVSSCFSFPSSAKPLFSFRIQRKEKREHGVNTVAQRPGIQSMHLSD